MAVEVVVDIEFVFLIRVSFVSFLCSCAPSWEG